MASVFGVGVVCFVEDYTRAGCRAMRLRSFSEVNVSIAVARDVLIPVPFVTGVPGINVVGKVIVKVYRFMFKWLKSGNIAIDFYCEIN